VYNDRQYPPPPDTITSIALDLIDENYKFALKNIVGTNNNSHNQSPGPLIRLHRSGYLFKTMEKIAQPSQTDLTD